MPFNLLSDADFKRLAESKRKLSQIVDECRGIEGVWLVIEETAASILIEVRYLEKLERDYLCDRVFSYVDYTPGAAQRVGRAGKNNEIIRIEVKWPNYGI